MAKNKINTDIDTTNMLTDMKRRERSGVYGEITLDIPFELFSDFIDNINNELCDYEIDEIERMVLAVRKDVQAEFERQLNDLDYDSLVNSYGPDFDFNFVQDMFAPEIEKYQAEEEAREAKEQAELLAQAKEREAEELRRRATLTTIEVSNENRQKAISILKAAGLIN
jgi:hypothetical protein